MVGKVPLIVLALALALGATPGGNPLAETANGWQAFVDDERSFSVDALGRLTGTAYAHGPTRETAQLDLVGNRESFTDRVGQTTAYTLANPANEYATIGGTTVTYDAAGNLAVDENLRTYSYDEHNRLTQVQAAGGTLLAAYTYDALGRRVTAQIGTTVTRYYHDGPNVIDERDASDTVQRLQFNGPQYIDERIGTYDVGTAAFTYYLHNLNYSIAGAGNAAGSNIQRLEYTPAGDSPPFCWKADANCDGHVDFGDIDPFVLALQDRPAWEAQYTCDYDCVNDVNGDGVVDFGDLDPFVACLTGGCGGNWGGPPPSGTFVMHGRAVDVLPDGKVLMDFRLRSYDPQHGRWLQRDGAGYADGTNLYEAFGTNAARFTDPTGLELWVKESERTFLETFYGKENVTFTAAKNGMFSVVVKDAGIQSLGNYVRQTKGSVAYAQRLSYAIRDPFYRWEQGLVAFNEGRGSKWIGQRYEGTSLGGGLIITSPDDATGLASWGGFVVPTTTWEFTTAAAFERVMDQVPQIALLLASVATIADPVPGDEALLGGAAVKLAPRGVATGALARGAASSVADEALAARLAARAAAPVRAVAASEAIPGQVGQFSRVSTPWGRNVWQRVDIDWALRRPDGLTNLEAARRGFSPLRQIGTAFEEVQLHHLNQDPVGSLAEVWRSTHQDIPHNVPPPSWRVTDPAGAATFRREVPAYWRWRAGQAGGS